MTKTEIRKIIFHGITIALIVISVCFSVFRFAPVFGRVIEAIKDAVTSIEYYILFICRKKNNVTPTIGILPENIETVLPITLEEFELLVTRWWTILKDFSYFEEYLEVVGEFLFNVSRAILMLTLPLALLVWFLYLTYKTNDTNHNKDSKALTFWKLVYSKTLRHAKYYVKKYIRFFSRQKWYKRILFSIWFYNLSGLTIAIETVAWYLYFFVTIVDFETTLVWIAKVLADFMVPVFFFPGWAWVIICYKIFDFLRCKRGRAGIVKGIKENVKFLKEHFGAKFLNGKQRSKKTSLMTQWKTLSESCILRPQAQQGWLNRTKQFPNFPWIVYARYLIEARKKHQIHNWTDIHFFLQFLQWADREFANKTEKTQRFILRHLKKRYGYKFDDFCFGYDRRKYGDIFDDGLELVTIYEALEGYGKQFFLYSQPTPLDVSNYPIRSDFEIEDFGNIPEFKNDLLEMDTRKSYKRTQWSHRINWDAFRLGKKFDPNNPENNSVEYMIRCSMEHAKERKNQLTRRSSDKEEGAPTQDNDLVETDTKVRTHIATCDNFTYQEDLADDQRAASLGADNVELMTKIYIRGSKSIKYYVPFFAIDEAVYLLTTAIFDKFYLFIRKRKGSNTALEAFLWKLYTPIYRHYTRYKNIYSYYPLELKIEDGADNEVLNADKKIPLISVIAYRGRFKTDSLSEFYYRKMKGSLMGLNDIEMYTGKSMTLQQMKRQNAYMIKDLTRSFGGSWENPIKEWIKETEKKEKAA